jgi:hypothetical protein
MKQADSLRAKATAIVEAKLLQDKLARDREAAVMRAQITELRRLTSAENRRQDSLRLVRDLVVMAEPPKLTPRRSRHRAPRATPTLS